MDNNILFYIKDNEICYDGIIIIKYIFMIYYKEKLKYNIKYEYYDMIMMTKVSKYDINWR